MDDLELRDALAFEVIGVADGSVYAPNDAEARENFLRGAKQAIADGPAYESTWEGMGLVIERMRERHCWLSLIYKAGYLEGNDAGEMAWVAEFRGGNIPGQPWTGKADQHSAPRAVALAALAAIRSEK